MHEAFNGNGFPLNRFQQIGQRFLFHFGSNMNISHYVTLEMFPPYMSKVHYDDGLTNYLVIKIMRKVTTFIYCIIHDAFFIGHLNKLIFLVRNLDFISIFFILFYSSSLS